MRIDTVKEVDPDDILLLQILLGSDIKREIYNFIRKYKGLKLRTWNKLYTKKMIFLKTRVGYKTLKDLSDEIPCPVLQRKVVKAIKESQNLEGHI